MAKPPFTFVYEGQLTSRPSGFGFAKGQTDQLGIDSGSDAPPLTATFSRDSSGQESLQISQKGELKLWSVRLKDRFGVRKGDDIKFYPLTEGLAAGCTGFILPRSLSLMSMNKVSKEVADSFLLDPANAVEINMVKGMEYKGEYDPTISTAKFRIYETPTFTVEYSPSGDKMPDEITFKEFETIRPGSSTQSTTDAPIFTAVWKKVSEAPQSGEISSKSFSAGVTNATVYRGRTGYGYNLESKSDPWKHYQQQEKQWAKLENSPKSSPAVSLVLGVSIAAGVALLAGVAWFTLSKKRV